MTKEALTLALETLEKYARDFGLSDLSVKAMYVVRQALAQPEQEKERCVGCEACINTACGRDECPKGWPKAAQPEQEPVAWRNAAIRVGEDLCSVGPFGYYDMNAEQWLDWALSVVTVHAPPPQRTWVGLTEEDMTSIITTMCNTDDGTCDTRSMCRAIEAKLKEKNT